MSKSSPNTTRSYVRFRGGADSDVMLDMFLRCGDKSKIDFIFFNTGVEYKATLDHLDELEKKYDIKIERVKALKPIPVCGKEYGQPFVSKQVSERIEALQRHGFKWEDEPCEVLEERYPKAKAAVQWWCNRRSLAQHSNAFNISYNKYLKEFLLANPPQFKISAQCCTWAKKKPSHKIVKERGYDLVCTGVRKLEGGVRAFAYKNCFTAGENDKVATFRPVFWFRNSDKDEYCEHYGVTHSKCYTEYGFERTGCTGCPFHRELFQDLEVVQKYEPNLYKAATYIFHDSYEYTKQYREFAAKMREEDKRKKREAKQKGKE